jgi:hypothetical protein
MTVITSRSAAILAASARRAAYSTPDIDPETNPS